MKKRFKVTVNLPEKIITIDMRKGIEIAFDELDEWNSFVDDDEKTWDIHLHYENELTVSIYPVINGRADTTNKKNWAKVELYAQIGTKTFKL